MRLTFPALTLFPVPTSRRLPPKLRICVPLAIWHLKNAKLRSAKRPISHPKPICHLAPIPYPKFPHFNTPKSKCQIAFTCDRLLTLLLLFLGRQNKQASQDRKKREKTGVLRDLFSTQHRVEWKHLSPVFVCSCGREKARRIFFLFVFLRIFFFTTKVVFSLCGCKVVRFFFPSRKLHNGTDCSVCFFSLFPLLFAFVQQQRTRETTT